MLEMLGVPQPLMDATVIKQRLVPHSSAVEAALLRFHFNVDKLKRGKSTEWRAGARWRFNLVTGCKSRCLNEILCQRLEGRAAVTHQLWGSGLICWWSAREKPKKVPPSPNLCSVWVVSRLKPQAWLERVQSAQRKKVQPWEEWDEWQGASACPSKAAIARCRGASSVQQRYRADSFHNSLKEAKQSKSTAVSSLVCGWL